ncbi:MAG TPA: threonine-phosphate decarboxylase CobD [Alphaproteobacteria bacterium]
MIVPPSSTSACAQHGGNLAEAEALFGRPREGWLDLSTGINPFSYAIPPLPADCWTRLPADDLALRRAAAACYGTGDPDCVVAASGSQAILQMLGYVLGPGTVAVLGPTYAELSRVWVSAGRSVIHVETLDPVPDADFIVIANPNNPDGRIHPPERLLPIARQLADRGGSLIVDEAFADAMPHASVADHVGMPGLIVLRSFGKFFGLPGLRLGFALAEPRLASSLRAALGPWPVSGPALTIGCTALADKPWIDQMRTTLALEADRLERSLSANGLTVIGGTPLFRLVETPWAAELFAHLGAQGIWVRRFSNRPNWLRFGLPGRDFARLAAALQQAPQRRAMMTSQVSGR